MSTEHINVNVLDVSLLLNGCLSFVLLHYHDLLLCWGYCRNPIMSWLFHLIFLILALKCFLFHLLLASGLMKIYHRTGIKRSKALCETAYALQRQSTLKHRTAVQLYVFTLARDGEREDLGEWSCQSVCLPHCISPISPGYEKEVYTFLIVIFPSDERINESRSGEAEMTLYNRRDYEHNIHTLIAIIKHGKAPPRRLHKVVIYLHTSLLFWACALKLHW